MEILLLRQKKACKTHGFVQIRVGDPLVIRTRRYGLAAAWREPPLHFLHRPNWIRYISLTCWLQEKSAIPSLPQNAPSGGIYKHTGFWTHMAASSFHQRAFYKGHLTNPKKDHLSRPFPMEEIRQTTT